MDWSTSEGLFFCWWDYLGILWCSDTYFAQKLEWFHVHSINIYWHRQCFNDGMLLIAFQFTYFEFQAKNLKLN